MIHQKNIHLSDIRQAANMPDGAHILIADHNSLDRMRLKKLCSELDFTNSVTEVDSLARLRAALVETPVDLVLLGSELHGGSGLEAADVIRAQSARHPTAIVRISDTKSRNGAAHAAGRGTDASLTLEDLSLDTLQNTVDAALRTYRRTPDTGNPPDFGRTGNGTQDVKLIVGRMMRQIRSLREVDQMDPLDAVDRVKQIEGSLHRLWAFLEILDDSTNPNDVSAPTIPAVRGEKPLLAASINARVPSERPAAKSVRPPSVFQRRPD